jgi:hypothetical protein
LQPRQAVPKRSERGSFGRSIGSHFWTWKRNKRHRETSEDMSEARRGENAREKLERELVQRRATIRTKSEHVKPNYQTTACRAVAAAPCRPLPIPTPPRQQRAALALVPPRGNLAPQSVGLAAPPAAGQARRSAAWSH